MRDPTRCNGTSKRSGKQCVNPPMHGTSVCRMHGGMAPQVQRKARERILAAADNAASVLIGLMEDERTPHPVRLAAARDLLDRAGEGAKQQVEVTTVDATDAELRALARSLAASSEPVSAEP